MGAGESAVGGGGSDEGAKAHWMLIFIFGRKVPQELCN